MIPYFVQGAGYGFVGAAQPGPFQAYVISQSLRLGWRRTLSAALAPLISDAPIITLVMLILSQIPLSMQRVLHTASGLFLIFLAWRAWSSWRQQNPDLPTSIGFSDRTLLKAVVVNLLSPGPYIYWSLVAGPALLVGWRNAPVSGIGFLAGFYGALVATLALIIITFGMARKLGPRVTYVLTGASIVVLVFFAIYQLWLGVGSSLLNTRA
jgi:threonine/homoserine/homoserine lactone efflux protein